MIKLECKKLRFCSELDETTFFDRMGKIKCIDIDAWEGYIWGSIIHVKSKKVSDVCLRELISLFYRYNISMSQLSIFLNEKNKKWLLNEKAYWYKKIFKNK